MIVAIPVIPSYPLPEPGRWPASRARWVLAPTRAALLVHDMQRYFLAPFDRTAAPLGPALTGVQALRRACEAAGVPVLFSMQPAEQDRRERGLLWDLWGPGLGEHPELAGLDPTLEPTARDVVFTKRRYNAFHGTVLAEQLATRGRDQLLVCGVYAHIGILATALDGFSRGIQPFVVADATADFSREDHDVALRQVARTCGVVTTVHDASQALAHGGEDPRA